MQQAALMRQVRTEISSAWDRAVTEAHEVTKLPMFPLMYDTMIPDFIPQALSTVVTTSRLLSSFFVLFGFVLFCFCFVILCFFPGLHTYRYFFVLFSAVTLGQVTVTKSL